MHTPITKITIISLNMSDTHIYVINSVQSRTVRGTVKVLIIRSLTNVVRKKMFAVAPTLTARKVCTLNMTNIITTMRENLMQNFACTNIVRRLILVMTKEKKPNHLQNIARLIALMAVAKVSMHTDISQTSIRTAVVLAAVRI